MKMRSVLLLLVMAAILSAAAPGNARAQSQVSFEFFYDSLSPYGEWMHVPGYDYCWRPWSVEPGWAPYTDGYWAYTDAGWTWVSYEDWGAITYHYGRWMRLARIGWAWVPGYDWGPAWVSWRGGDDYVGWAPLPPEVPFVRNTGISIWVDFTYGIAPAYYNFCSYRDFGAPVLRPVIIDRRRNYTIVNNTTNITNITVNQTRNVIFNGGLDPRFVERRSRHRIPTLNLVQETNPAAVWNARGGHYSRQQGNQLLVVAPQVDRPQGHTRPPNYARVLQTASVDTGWSALSASQATALKSKMREQLGNRTPDNAPATRVNDQHIRFVQERVQPSPAATPPAALAQTPAPPTAAVATQATSPVPTPSADQGRHKGKPGLGASPAEITAQPTVPATTQSTTAAPSSPSWHGRKNRPVDQATAAPQLTQPTEPSTVEPATVAAPTPPVPGPVTAGRRERFLKQFPQQQPSQVPQQIVQPTPNQELQQRQAVEHLRKQKELDVQQEKQLQAEQARQLKIKEQQAQQQQEQQAQQEALRQQKKLEAEQAKQQAAEQQQLQQQEANRQQRQIEAEQTRQRAQQEAAQQQRQVEAEQARQRAQEQQMQQQRQQEAIQQQRQAAEQARERALQQQQQAQQQLQQPQAERQRKIEAFRQKQQEQVEELRRRAPQPQQPAPQVVQPQQVQPQQPPQRARERKLTKEEEEALRQQQQQQR